MSNIVSWIEIEKLKVKEGRKDPVSLMEGQKLEIQFRKDGFLLFGKIKDEKHDEELFKHVANENNLDVAWRGTFKKDLTGNIDKSYEVLYKSLCDIVHALVQFSHDAIQMTTVSAKVSTQVANRLKTEKNASETIRLALEKHFAAESNKQT